MRGAMATLAARVSVDVRVTRDASKLSRLVFGVGLLPDNAPKEALF